MFKPLLTSFVVALLFSQVVNAQSGSQKFPLTATITASRALVRSGPAKVHYATDRLAKGTKVQVYRLDPDGWCAIRPPKRSFSIVPSSAIEQTDSDLGIVRENKTPAWVGTLLGSVRKPMQQVQLRRNERVEILGMIETPAGPNEKQAWFQIKPPSGEYRWIHIDHLDAADRRLIKIAAGEIDPNQNSRIVRGGTRTGRNDVRQVSHTTISTSDERVTQDQDRKRRRQPSIPTQPIDNTSTQPIRTASNNYSNQIPTSEPQTTGWRPARKPLRQIVDTAGINNDSLHNSNTSYIGNSVPTQPITSRALSQSTPPTGLIPVGGSSTSNSDELRALDVALSTEMLKQPSQWNLSSIKQRALSIRNSTVNANHRDHASRILNKITNCERLAQNGQNSALANQQRSATGSDNSSEMAQRYDAFGVLQELVRDGGLGQTTYVLQNSAGKITHHIKGVPGLNLHRYLKKRIGIIGQRGFNRELNLQHVTAQRIIDFETIRR